MKAAVLARVKVAMKCLQLGISSLRPALEVLLLLVGGSVVGYVVLGLKAPLVALSLLLLAVLVALIEGSYRLHQIASAARANAEGAVRNLEVTAPKLSLGPAVIPAKSQTHEVHWRNGETFTERGRVIRVPVQNALGSEPALGVRAKLLFQPNDRGSHSPKHPMPGQWDEPGGPVEEVDLPGNGNPRYLDILYVRDRPYPHGFAWTRWSREAGLAGFIIAAGRIEIEVEVSASGPTEPQAKDTLTIECHPRQMLTAAWSTQDNGEGQGRTTEWWDGENR
jgi:hypothetical protein